MGSDLKRKIIDLLDQVFPEFESQFSSIFGKTALAGLRQYSALENQSKARTRKTAEVLQAASNRRELARDGFGIPDCKGATRCCS